MIGTTEQDRCPLSLRIHPIIVLSYLVGEVIDSFVVLHQAFRTYFLWA